MAKGFSFDALVNVVYPFNRKALAPTVDLNTLNGEEDIGVYRLDNSAHATPANNYPTQLAGSLEVLPAPRKAGVGVIQRYTVHANGDTYTRGIYGSTSISAWQKLISNVDVFKAVYPIGIVVTFAVEVNPNTTFPGTTWTRITDTKQVRPSESAASVGTIGGSDTYTLTGANMPAHTHTVAAHTHVAPAHSHTISHDHANATTKSAGAHTHTINPFARNGDGGNGKDNGNPYWIGDPASHTTSYSGEHTHVVDIPAFNGYSGSGGGSATSSAGGGNTGSAGNTTSFSTSGAWRKYGIWQRTA